MTTSPKSAAELIATSYGLTPEIILERKKDVRIARIGDLVRMIIENIGILSEVGIPPPTDEELMTLIEDYKKYKEKHNELSRITLSLEKWEVLDRLCSNFARAEIRRQGDGLFRPSDYMHLISIDAQLMQLRIRDRVASLIPKPRITNDFKERLTNLPADAAGLHALFEECCTVLWMSPCKNPKLEADTIAIAALEADEERELFIPDFIKEFLEFVEIEGEKIEA